ncbi:HNH endonuclease [Nonomuraea sp. CA-218870]|uniref:HNH endonuclease n=1 Tax=Nonomuraea sp. CA-218870 TaxID=3239998 RepID=UPI003D93D5A1
MPPRRAPLKQGKPPERRTPLKQGQPPARQSPIQQRKPLTPGKSAGQPNPPARKSSRPKPVPAEVKDLLKARSSGVCEVGLTCGGFAAGTDPAHREGKKAGGTRKPWSNTASNLLWSCRPCHDLIDQKQPANAEKLGLKVREGVARPWEVPGLHAHLGWVLLDDRGGYRPAPAGSHQNGKRPVPVVPVAALDEAAARYGHGSCPPGGVQAGPYVCGCGDIPFWLEAAS